MKPRLIDILNQKEEIIEEEKMSAYLRGQLDPQACHDVEAAMTSGSDMESDALEGWLAAPMPNRLVTMAHEINQKIAHQLKPASTRRKTRAIHQWPLLWWLTGTVLLLVILASVIIYWMRH